MPNIIARVRSIAGASSTTPAQLRYFRSASASDIGIAGAPGGISQRTRVAVAVGQPHLDRGRKQAVVGKVVRLPDLDQGHELLHQRVGERLVGELGLPSAPKHSAAATQ